jgi:hypothetical protein
MVGAVRFELTAPCSQSRCATRLRHAPIPLQLSHWQTAENLGGFDRDKIDYIPKPQKQMRYQTAPRPDSLLD